VNVLKEIGTGKEYVYVYYNPKDRDNNVEWECKIGKSVNHPIIRIQKQKIKTAFSYEPEIGLIIKVDNCGLLERHIHTTLASSKIRNEWFKTNPTIVENCFWNLDYNSENILSGIDLGFSIRKRREELNLTQVELAKLCGLRQATISRVEKGVDDITMDTLMSLIEHLNLKLSITPQ